MPCILFPEIRYPVTKVVPLVWYQHSTSTCLQPLVNTTHIQSQNSVPDICSWILRLHHLSSNSLRSCKATKVNFRLLHTPAENLYFLKRHLILVKVHHLSDGQRFGDVKETWYKHSKLYVHLCRVELWAPSNLENVLQIEQFVFYLFVVLKFLILHYLNYLSFPFCHKHKLLIYSVCNNIPLSPHSFHLSSWAFPACY